MARCSAAVLFSGLSVLLCDVSASAATLRCRSVNGNLNCAGSGGASCQSVDGRTVCVSGDGAVVQSFGNGPAADMAGDGTTGAGLQGRDDAAPDRAVTPLEPQ